MAETKTIIIGANLTGLSLARLLKNDDRDIELLEATQLLGGRFRGDGADLGYIAPSDSALRTLEWLRRETPLQWNEIDEQPLVFESNSWRPFLGFGDFPSSVVNELTFFNPSKQWLLEPGLEQVTRALCEQMPVEPKFRHEVTGFECTDGRVTAAIVNGQTKIAGDNFIFCPAPHLLGKLLPADALKPATRSRLAKQQVGWSAVTLSLRHRQPLQESPAMRFVLGTGKEFEPVIGRIWPTHSVWLNLVSSEREEDLEHLGDCVRFMRRTLKRVAPDLMNQVGDEKIRVRPQAFGPLDLKLKNYAFPELPNLLLADPRLGSVNGDLGAATMALELSTLFVAEPRTSVLSDSQQLQ